MQIFKIFLWFVSWAVIVSAKKTPFRVNLPTLSLSPFRIEHVLRHQQVFNSSGTIPSVFLITVDSEVENMSVISACSRIKYCIIDNPDIKTWHDLPRQVSSQSPVTKRSNIYILLLHLSRETLSLAWLEAILDRKETAVNPVLPHGESFAHSHALWFCDRKLPTAGGTAGEIWCFVDSELQSDFSQSVQQPQSTTSKTQRRRTVIKKTLTVARCSKYPIHSYWINKRVVKWAYHATGWLRAWVAEGLGL